MKKWPKCSKDVWQALYLKISHTIFLLNAYNAKFFSRGWGEVLKYICPKGMCRFVGYYFHLFLPERGLKIRQFSGAACQNLSNGKFLFDRLVCSFKFLCFGV